VKSLPSNLTVWFGILGGPLAWATQFVTNLFFSFAKCNSPGGDAGLAVHGWEIALSAVAVAIGVTALSLSIRLFRSSLRLDHVIQDELEGKGSPPPTGRLAMLSMVGITVNSLVLIIIVMTAIGAPLLPACQQS
jgi:hypothetical protein